MVIIINIIIFCICKFGNLLLVCNKLCRVKEVIFYNENMQQRVNTIAVFLSSYHYQDIPISLLQVKGEKML